MIVVDFLWKNFYTSIKDRMVMEIILDINKTVEGYIEVYRAALKS